VAQCGDLPKEVIAKYRAESAGPVLNDLAECPQFSGIRVVSRNFFRAGQVARHDSDLLAETIHAEFLAPLARRGELRARPAGVTQVADARAVPRGARRFAQNPKDSHAT
jgi:aminoglycoside phosphotransferase (APT) family kinase protein